MRFRVRSERILATCSSGENRATAAFRPRMVRSRFRRTTNPRTDRPNHRRLVHPNSRSSHSFGTFHSALTGAMLLGLEPAQYRWPILLLSLLPLLALTTNLFRPRSCSFLSSPNVRSQTRRGAAPELSVVRLLGICISLLWRTNRSGYWPILPAQILKHFKHLFAGAFNSCHHTLVLTVAHQ